MMLFKENFKNIYSHELKASIFKSLIYSLLVSFAVLFQISTVFWILAFNKYWISLIVFAIVEVVMFFVFFFFFKPNDKKIAKKLDSLGLAQRVVTMYEYQDNDSLMARVQRNNAIEHINKVNTKLLKLVIPAVVIVFASIAFVLGAGATTAAALSSHGVIESGKETISDILPTTPIFYEVVYEVDGNGEIEGEIFQVVLSGEDATAIMAIASDGWAFTGWSDEYPEPYREDKNINSDATYTAYFMELELSEEDSDEEADPEDSESDLPQDLGDNQSPAPSVDPSAGIGGGYDPTNFVIDGNTSASGPTYDNALNDAMDGLQNSGISSEGQDVVGDYFSNIAK